MPKSFVFHTKFEGKCLENNSGLSVKQSIIATAGARSVRIGSGYQFTIHNVHCLFYENLAFKCRAVHECSE